MLISVRLASREVCAYRGVQVDKDGTGHVFAATGLGEEGLEGTALGEVCRIGVGTAVGKEAMLQQVPG